MFVLAWMFQAFLAQFFWPKFLLPPQYQPQECIAPCIQYWEWTRRETHLFHIILSVRLVCTTQHLHCVSGCIPSDYQNLSKLGYFVLHYFPDFNSSVYEFAKAWPWLGKYLIITVGYLLRKLPSVSIHQDLWTWINKWQKGQQLFKSIYFKI